MSAVFDALLIATGTIGGCGSLFAPALMWTPAAAVLVTGRLFGDGWRDYGWRPGRMRYQAVAYGLVRLAGRGGFTGGWPSNLPVFVVRGRSAGPSPRRARS